MQKQLRIGVLLFVLLLVVETARLFIAAQERIDIQILAVEQPPVSKVLADALGVTPTRWASATPVKTSASQAATSQPGSTLRQATAGLTHPASKPTLRPSPEPTASPTPTLVPYRTVIPENKSDRQVTAHAPQAATATPAGGNPEQPTNPLPAETSSAPNDPPPATPTAAPADLPTSAPAEPPTPQLPTEAP